MAAASKIEWTDKTWNPVRARLIGPDEAVITRPDPKTGADRPWWGYHCEHVSPGCANCYAETMNKRGFPSWGTLLDYKPGLLDGPLPPAVCDRLEIPRGSRLEMVLDEAELTAPLSWRKPAMVFVCSMTDLFARFVPDDWIDRVFAVMALCPQHTFQVLTKRSARMRAYVEGLERRADEQECQSPTDYLLAHCIRDEWWRGMGARVPIDHPWPLPNVWLGVSPPRQKEADLLIPDLLATSAAVRFVSAEPLLGPLRLDRIEESVDTFEDCGGHPDSHWPLDTHDATWLDALRGEMDGEARAPDGARRGDIDVGLSWPGGRLDWVICGGESGPNARPMHPDWARALRDQCAAAGVPFFFKQWGEWLPVDSDHPGLQGPGFGQFDHCPVNEPGAATHVRVGKKRAGRLLDGRTHDDLPAGLRLAKGEGA